MRWMFWLVLAGCLGPGSKADKEEGLLPDSDRDGIPDEEEGDDPDDNVGPADIVTDRYPVLRVEIDVVGGADPVSASLARVEEEVAALIASGHLGKPGGFELVIDQTLADPEVDTWTFEALRDLLRSEAGPDTDGDAVVIHGLYVPGGFQADSSSSRVLGFAYGDNEMVMFRDNIDHACASSGLPLVGLRSEACQITEAGVLLHELGHLFGLVNNGTPMASDHQDPDHGAHDIDPDCLMYWAAERTEAMDIVAARLLGGDDPLPGFDAACLEDLAASQ